MGNWGFRGGVPIELSPDGSVTLPNGQRYRRSPERLKRSNGQSAIDAGAPVITDVYLEGTVLFMGEAARDAWAQIKPRLVVDRGGSAHDLTWKGQIWTADDDSCLLHVTGYH